jgi:hypothetical protein
MKRSVLAAAAIAGLLAVALPAAAAAQVVELGSTKTALVPPVCPPGVSAVNCTIVLNRTTAIETIRDGVLYPTTVKQAGYIVAWTVGLSRLSTNNKSAHTAIHYLDHTFGGNTEVGIDVLKPVGPASQRNWQVVAASPIIHVQPWLGYVVQFPLTTALPVSPGDVIALTVPTWAPVLSFDLSASKFAYRQSRASGCFVPEPSSTAQLTVGQSARYLCSYTGTRVEYSATEITTPGLPKNQLHTVRRLY